MFRSEHVYIFEYHVAAQLISRNDNEEQQTHTRTDKCNAVQFSLLAGYAMVLMFMMMSCDDGSAVLLRFIQWPKEEAKAEVKEEERRGRKRRGRRRVGSDHPRHESLPQGPSTWIASKQIHQHTRCFVAYESTVRIVKKRCHHSEQTCMQHIRNGLSLGKSYTLLWWQNGAVSLNSAQQKRAWEYDMSCDVMYRNVMRCDVKFWFEKMEDS